MDSLNTARTRTKSLAACIFYILLAISTIYVQIAFGAKYDPGASDKEIKIGHTGPYSGPASAHGTVGRAIAAYFKKLNENGGVNGRRISFITYDDGYNPVKTMEQVRRLVEQDQVLLVFNPLGTPPNSAIQNYMNQQKVPQLFVGSGAAKWANPKNFPWTMGWQPSYYTEGVLVGKYIAKMHPGAAIGVLYQNDDFGKDYLAGLKKGTSSGQAKIVKEETYEVTDLTIDHRVVALKQSGANVFFNATTPKFAVQAIRKATEIGWRPIHILNSASSSVQLVLSPLGAESTNGLVSAVYLKDPSDAQWSGDKGMKDWKEFMKKYYPDGSTQDVLNVYGYSVAKTLEHVLQRAGDDLTRANIMKQAASIKNLNIPTFLPGIKLNTDPDQFLPIRAMRFQRFDSKLNSWTHIGPTLECLNIECCCTDEWGVCGVCPTERRH